MKNILFAAVIVGSSPTVYENIKSEQTQAERSISSQKAKAAEVQNQNLAELRLPDDNDDENNILKKLVTHTKI